VHGGPGKQFTMRELTQPIMRVAFGPAAITPVAYPAIPTPGPGGLAGATWITGETGRRVELTIAVGRAGLLGRVCQAYRGGRDPIPRRPFPG
jgi:hypothetical protein